MKYARKFFGALAILMVVSLVFWLPADMASTKSPVSYTHLTLPTSDLV